MLADGHLDGNIFTKAGGDWMEPELLELKRVYEAQIAKEISRGSAAAAAGGDQAGG